MDEGNGKKKPIKIGLAPVQRDGMEYEFTLVMDLSVEGHVATATKDRTGLFDGAHFVPGMETGEALREWLVRGKDPAEESKRLLQRLKAALPKLKDVPQLNAWWRQNAAEIAQLAPADADLWGNLGIVLSRHGELDEAEVAFRKALDLAPDLPLAFPKGVALILSVGQQKKAFTKRASLYRREVND